MAFEIDYSSVNLATTAYADAVRRVRPGMLCGLIYSQHQFADEMTVMLFPKEKMFFIACDFDYWQMRAYCKVDIDEDDKALRVVACACKADNFWSDICPETPHGDGGAWFFKRCIDSLQDDLITYAMVSFFDENWRVIIDTEVTQRVAEAEQEQVVDMMQHLPTVIFHSPRVLGHFEPDLVAMANAVTKIAAVFRGWKTRMTYRFNPHNRLGKHLVLKFGGF